MIKAIVAKDLNNAIGASNNTLLTHLPLDLKHFKDLTNNSIVIMGHTTFKSLPMYPEGLPNRINIVLTRDVTQHYLEDDTGVWYTCYDTLMVYLNNLVSPEKDVYIIGGASIYKLFEHQIKMWIVTTIYHKFEDACTYLDVELPRKDWYCRLITKDVSSDKYKAFVHTFIKTKETTIYG